MSIGGLPSPTIDPAGSVFSPMTKLGPTVEPSPSGPFASPASVSSGAVALPSVVADPPGPGGSTDWLRVPLVIGVVLLLSSALLAFGIRYDSTHRGPWQ